MKIIVLLTPCVCISEFLNGLSIQLLALEEAACHSFVLEANHVLKVSSRAEKLIPRLSTDAFANGAWLGLKIAGMILAALLCKLFRALFLAKLDRRTQVSEI